MAIIERKVLITDKDSQGNTTYDFPITSADCVEGLANVAKTGKYSDLKNIPTLATDPLIVGSIKVTQPISSGTSAEAKYPNIHFVKDAASESATYNINVLNSIDNGLSLIGRDKISKLQFVESPRDAKANSSIPVISSVHGYWWTSKTDHGARETQAIIKTNEYYDSTANTYRVGSELHGNTEIKLSVGSKVSTLDSSGNLKVNNGITGTSLTVTGQIRASNFYPVGAVYLSTTKLTVAQLSSMFGGTWVQIGGGYTLVAANDTTYKAMQTGGSATQKLTTAQMPSHDHDKGSFRIRGYFGSTEAYDADTINGYHGCKGPFKILAENVIQGNTPNDVHDNNIILFDTSVNTHSSDSDYTSGKWGWTGTTGKTGGTDSFSIMQPYFVVYMYYRKS